MKEIFVIKDCNTYFPTSSFYLKKVHHSLHGSGEITYGIGEFKSCTEFVSYSQAMEVIKTLDPGLYQIEKIFKVG